MKIIKFGYMTALVLGGLLACASVASAQDAKDEKKGERKGPPSVEQQMERMKTELNLTSDQEPKVKAVLEDSAKKRAELRDAAPEDRREKGRALMEEQDKKLKEILTEEQYTKWQKLREQYRKNRPGGPGGPEKSGDVKKD